MYPKITSTFAWPAIAQDVHKLFPNDGNYPRNIRLGLPFWIIETHVYVYTEVSDFIAASHDCRSKNDRYFADLFAQPAVKMVS